MASRSGELTPSAPLFAALGDETRLKLVARLCEGGPLSIARLTSGTRITRQAITKHLLVLADAGLVRGVRRGRESHWELEVGRLDTARRYLNLISDQWTQRLAALEQHLDSMPGTDSIRKRKRR